MPTLVKLITLAIKGTLYDIKRAIYPYALCFTILSGWFSFVININSHTKLVRQGISLFCRVDSSK